MEQIFLKKQERKADGRQKADGHAYIESEGDADQEYR